MADPTNISVLNFNILQFNLNFTQYFILIILGLVLCTVSPLIMQNLSREISRLSVFHRKEKIWIRVKRLYLTYLHIMTIMWFFIGFSLFSFVSQENILIYTLISSSVLSLTTRIIVTTGLVNCSELENDLKMEWCIIRERVLSAVYSATVITVIIAFVGIFILVMLWLSGQGSSFFDRDYLFHGSLIPSVITIFILWLGYPLILATVGESLRWLISIISPPPSDLLVEI
jgi:hypothetical protein